MTKLTILDIAVLFAILQAIVVISIKMLSLARKTYFAFKGCEFDEVERRFESHDIENLIGELCRIKDGCDKNELAVIIDISVTSVWRKYD